MKVHQDVLDKLKVKFEMDDNNVAFLLTGSVARGEESELSDLDLILIDKEPREREEFIEGKIVVEIKSNTAEGYIAKMEEKPMNVYQWLDAKVVYDKENSSRKIIRKAKEIYDNYVPSQDELSGTIKWLQSGREKILSSQAKGDKLAVGYSVSNILWIIIKGLYLHNNKPLPPSTTAFRRIKQLEKLPKKFDSLWEDALVGNLEDRTDSTIKLIDLTLSL